MIVLADRYYSDASTITALAAIGADLLIRVRHNHPYPITGQLPDGSLLSRTGTLTVRIVRVEITTRADTGDRRETYQLVSAICDPPAPRSSWPSSTTSAGRSRPATSS
jgi:hypothetical protein